MLSAVVAAPVGVFHGVRKLGIPCAKGTERIALDAWLHGRTPERKKAGIAQDGKAVDIMKLWGAK